MIFMRFLALLGILTVLLVAGPVLTHYFEGHLTMSPPPEKEQIEAVMVFSGSTDRLVEGYDYFINGKTQKLMITGDDYARIAARPAVKKLLRKIKKHKDRIYIDLLARNTIENAENGAQWALKNHVKNILLITTEGHMARAYFELRRLLPEDVKIYTKPVSGSHDRYVSLDTEKSRLICRMYETTTGTNFCYQARNLIRSIDARFL